MAYKNREKPLKLFILESLDNRMTLSKESRNELRKSRSGFEGEGEFDVSSERLTCDCLILNDLELEHGSTDFQVDALIITPQENKLYEIKNYKGEYEYADDFLYLIPSYDRFQNPLERVNRNIALLGSLLKSHNMSMPIKSYVAYVHPEFMLYKAPIVEKLLMRSTLPKHFQELNRTTGSLSSEHYRIADKLCELSALSAPFLKGIPEYTFESLKKGVTCLECGKFVRKIPYRGRSYVCRCGRKESVSASLGRHVIEYKRLFPKRKVSVPAIHEWCGELYSERRIRDFLQRTYTAVSAGKYVHYV